MLAIDKLEHTAIMAIREYVNELRLMSPEEWDVDDVHYEAGGQFGLLLQNAMNENHMNLTEQKMFIKGLKRQI